MRLDELNHDCLVHNFNKLLRADDVVNLSHTCDRFRQAVEDVQLNYAVCFHNRKSTEEESVFFETYGRNISQLVVKPDRNVESKDTLIRLIDKHCNHLKQFKISHHTIDLAEIQGLFSYILQSLDISHCNINPLTLRSAPPMHLTQMHLTHNAGIDSDTVANWIRSNPLLKCISLHDDQKMFTKQKGQNLCLAIGQLEHLECLAIGLTVPTISKDLADLSSLALLPKLDRLLINKYSNGHTLVEALARNPKTTLTQLQLIGVDMHPETITLIPCINSLITLAIHKDYRISDMELEALSAGGQLTDVDLFDCLHISDVGLISLIVQNPHLERVQVTWCYRLTADLVRMLEEVFANSTRKFLCIALDGPTKISASLFGLSVNSGRFSIIRKDTIRSIEKKSMEKCKHRPTYQECCTK